MTKQQAIWAMEEGKKVRHRYFSSDEWISLVDRRIISEDGVRHDEFWELHADAAYETDWEIFVVPAIEIRVLSLKTAIEINSLTAGKDFIIEEIELGIAPNRKSIKYENDFLKKGTECKAIIKPNGKLRII